PGGAPPGGAPPPWFGPAGPGAGGPGGPAREWQPMAAMSYGWDTVLRDYANIGLPIAAATFVSTIVNSIFSGNAAGRRGRGARVRRGSRLVRRQSRRERLHLGGRVPLLARRSARPSSRVQRGILGRAVLRAHAARALFVLDRRHDRCDRVHR